MKVRWALIVLLVFFGGCSGVLQSETPTSSSNSAIPTETTTSMTDVYDCDAYLEVRLFTTNGDSTQTEFIPYEDLSAQMQTEFKQALEEALAFKRTPERWTPSRHIHYNGQNYTTVVYTC